MSMINRSRVIKMSKKKELLWMSWVLRNCKFNLERLYNSELCLVLKDSASMTG